MPINSAPSSVQQYVFFGDSLSDNGNLLNAAMDVLPPEVLGQISGFEGRASDGPTFAEYVAGLTGLPQSLNYAVAGGEATGTQLLAEFIDEFGLTGQIIVPPDDPLLTFDMNLGAQVDRFAADAQGSDVSPLAAFILAGGNDYLALRDASDPLSAALGLFDTIGTTVEATIGAAFEIAQTGVGRVVISSLPSAGFVPAIGQLGGTVTGIVDFLIDLHNEGLQSGVSDLVEAGIDAVYFDLQAITDAILDDPTGFGLYAPLSLTLTEGDPNELASYDDSQVAFWDSIHPSAASHGIIGAYTAHALNDPAVALGGGDDNVTLNDSGELVLAYGGNDQVIGGSGDDIVFLGSGNDAADGAGGDDVLSGGAGNDMLMGGDDNDILSGGVGNDTVLGGAGDDVIIDGLGADSMTGGDGNDIFIFFDPGLIGGSSGGQPDTMNGGNGDDALLVVLSQDTVDDLVDQGLTSESEVFDALGIIATDFEQIELLVGLESLEALDNLDWYDTANIWNLL
ncbi:MAG: SGNH/GDSL hydrolase family protein [Pseudomonadota bacterium]